jgi:hypothetical protein
MLRMQFMQWLRTPGGIYATSWVLAGVLMWVGARVAGLPRPNFVRAEIAALGATLVIWTVPALLGEFGLVGFGFALLITLWIIKEVFETSWGAALLVWVFNASAQAALVVVGWDRGVLQRGLIHTFLH